MGDEVCALRSVWAGRKNRRHHRLRCIPATAEFLPHGADRAGATRVRGAAAAVEIHRPGQPTLALSRHGACHADRVFYRIVFGNLTDDHGMCGEECRCFQPNHQLCAATGCHHQYGRHRTL